MSKPLRGVQGTPRDLRQAALASVCICILTVREENAAALHAAGHELCGDDLRALVSGLVAVEGEEHSLHLRGKQSVEKFLRQRLRA